jgi:L,D-peptidoglycan transpeptidase YkuD (ErfK/YbiS/YcfS/YnhG family)
MNRALRSVLIAAASVAVLLGTLSPTAAHPVPHQGTAARPRPTAGTRNRQPFPGNPGGALQVVSVVAATRASTTATLTRWHRAAVGAPWRSAGRPAAVFVGSGGLTQHDREGSAKTPIGSFTLTHAYGRDANRRHAVTHLMYRQLRPGDGWSSRYGPDYNRFEQSTGEMYDGRDSWTRDAVLIDYNLNPVRQGSGSGYFLHVGNNAPTAGCVGAPLPTVRSLLRWLEPSAHPRIVIVTER